MQECSILPAVRKCSTPCVSTSSVMLFRKLWYTIRSCCYLWCRAYRRCTQLELFQLERLARGGPHRYKHGNPLVAEGYRKSVDCVTVWPSAGAPTTGWCRRCGLIARMQQVHQSSHLSALQCTGRHEWLSELLAGLAQSRDCAPLCQQTSQCEQSLPSRIV